MYTFCGLGHYIMSAENNLFANVALSCQQTYIIIN